MGDTILVCHLPSFWSNGKLCKFVLHFGAIRVARMNCNRALVQFASQGAAQTGLLALHQLTIEGDCRLIVEYCNWNPAIGASICELRPSEHHKFVPLSQRFPPVFAYPFPPPTQETISNVCQQLWTNPQLYTQVLHLMRSMGLDAPFATSRGPAKNGVAVEMQDDDDVQVFTESSIVELQDLPSESKKMNVNHKLGRLKTVRKSERIQIQTAMKARKIDIISPAVLTANSSASTEATGSFGTLDPPAKIPENPPKRKECFDFSNCLSIDEIRSQVLSEEKRKNLKVFKNYSAGNPCRRLYLKNLSKKCTETDLKQIFGAFVDAESETQVESFAVNLLSSGRMHGQAFVTYENVTQAQNALDNCCGFVLHQKPIVVVFARNTP